MDHTTEILPTNPYDEDIQAWLRQIDPRSPYEMLADLEKLRRLEGVTEESKRNALIAARERCDYDPIALIDLCRSWPSIRSAAFYGPVMEREKGVPRILFDFNEALLPPERNLLGILWDIDVRCTEIFNSPMDTTDYSSVASEIRRHGFDHWVSRTAQVFYAV